MILPRGPLTKGPLLTMNPDTFNLDFKDTYPNPGFRKPLSMTKMNRIPLKRDTSITLRTISDFVDHYSVDILNSTLMIDGAVKLNADGLSLHQLPIFIEDITGNFDCSGNKFEVFDNRFPSTVGGNFSCCDGPLTSTKNIPITRFNIDVSRTRITKLEDLEHQSLINLFVNGTAISSLEGAPKYIDNCLDASNCHIHSLVNVHKHLKYCEILDIGNNPLSTGGIGLLLVKGLRKVTFSTKTNMFLKAFDAMEIINGYIPKGKAGLLTCQEELINNGLSEFAKL